MIALALLFTLPAPWRQTHRVPFEGALDATVTVTPINPPIASVTADSTGQATVLAPGVIAITETGTITGGHRALRGRDRELDGRANALRGHGHHHRFVQGNDPVGGPGLLGGAVSAHRRGGRVRCAISVVLLALAAGACSGGSAPSTPDAAPPAVTATTTATEAPAAEATTSAGEATTPAAEPSGSAAATSGPPAPAELVGDWTSTIEDPFEGHEDAVLFRILPSSYLINFGSRTTGRLTVQGDQMLLSGSSEPCAGEGIYTWRLDGDALMLTLVEDTCLRQVALDGVTYQRA